LLLSSALSNCSLSTDNSFSANTARCKNKKISKNSWH
jgi:hypothetical protein